MCCHEQRLALGLSREEFYRKNPCECHPLCRCARFGCDRCKTRETKPVHADHYVCFPCRKYGKRGVKEGDVQAEGIILEDGKRCPQCKSPMIPVGVDFKPPRFEDKRSWLISEQLFQNLQTEGKTFAFCDIHNNRRRPPRKPRHVYLGRIWSWEEFPFQFPERSGRRYVQDTFRNTET
jgi:hypothetical protein